MGHLGVPVNTCRPPHGGISGGAGVVRLCGATRDGSLLALKLLVWRFLKTGGPEMLRMMNEPPSAEADPHP